MGTRLPTGGQAGSGAITRSRERTVAGRTFSTRPTSLRSSGLRPDDDRPGAAPVVVLADRAYRRRFGADPAVVGSTLRVNGHPFTVVGVAPRGFVGVNLEARADGRSAPPVRPGPVYS
ncbi:MAG TPA: ABC transporter permease [Vicinamibacteria bacterium]|nr:ABC transporter permease [Vicinamibacteria bacterium]